jgi:hypothetical protein
MIFGEFLKKRIKFEAVGTAPLNQFMKIFYASKMCAIDSPSIKTLAGFPAKIQIFTFLLQ